MDFINESLLAQEPSINAFGEASNLHTREEFIAMLPDSPQRIVILDAVRAGTIDTTPGNFNTDADLAQYEVIWVEGDTTIQGSTIGCTTSVSGGGTCPVANRRPSIVIINGDASFTGTPHIYGILFVTGAWGMAARRDRSITIL